MIVFFKYFLNFSFVFFLSLIVKRQLFPSNIFFYESIALLLIITLLFVIYFTYKKFFIDKLLNKEEKDYILKYHLMVYSKLSNFLNTKEKRWLIKNL